MRGTEAGRRLIVLALPFTGFGLLWALAPPISGDSLPTEQTLRRSGWLLAGLGVAAIALGGYLIWRGEERIV